MHYSQGRWREPSLDTILRCLVPNLNNPGFYICMPAKGKQGCVSPLLIEGYNWTQGLHTRLFPEGS